MSGPETVAALKRAGFVFERQNASHVILIHRDRALSVSVPVHGGKDLPSGTLRGIIADAGLTVGEFQRWLK